MYFGNQLLTGPLRYSPDIWKMVEPIVEFPYEPGTYLVCEPSGQQSQWNVGSRLKLIKVLGEGSFSCVCLARDEATGDLVRV